MTTRTMYQVYRVDEVARIFKLTPRAVRTLIRDGELPAIRLGRDYRIPRSVIEKFFAEPLKTNFTPEDLGFGIWKSRRYVRDSVAYVNRMRARNKKTLVQVVAELEKWQFR